MLRNVPKDSNITIIGSLPRTGAGKPDKPTKSKIAEGTSQMKSEKSKESCRQTGGAARWCACGRRHADAGPGAQAQSDLEHRRRIAAGYAASPVPLNLTGKNQAQVGIGSYIVNTHRRLQPLPQPTPSMSRRGNPYDLPPPNGPYTGKIVNGKASSPSIKRRSWPAARNSVRCLQQEPDSPHRIPTSQARPRKPPTMRLGGIDWPTFWGVLHNGTDIDKILLSANGVQPGPHYVRRPANDALLQVMPWPAVRHLTDSDLNAVWQYLSAIPCTSNNPKSRLII